MSLFTSLYGSGAGAPIGSIAVSPINMIDDSWLPLTGGIYNKADYPELDTSKLLTFQGSSVTTGVTLPSLATCRVFHVTGNIWYAYSTVSGVSACYRSTDNGVTWTSGTLPQSPSGYWPVSYANGMFFQTRNDNSATNTYYTSADGLSWTTRTSLPILGGSFYQAYGGVVHISGRYVMLPSYCNVTANGLWALYSSDGLTWTASILGNNNSGGVSHSSTPLYYLTSFGKADVIPEIGLQVFALYNGYQYHTLDGVTWLNNTRYTVTSTLDSGVTTGQVGWSGSGGYASSASLLAIGNHQRSNRKTNAGFSGFPLRGTNLTIANGISEDYGVSKSTSISVPWYNVTSDFSGTRLLNISSAGLVSFIDVNPAKFRAVAPLQDAELPLMGQTLYIKAR